MSVGTQSRNITTVPPAYFQRIKEGAAKRWDQLEADPELAGPWHQLFMQVQSPRHILSELLQNADDAGATEARVSIEDQRFVFEHNGEDFIEAHFASICRFGYSNKRALHTIGFRGIGFKSTFSLGGRVELLTPTLAVAFQSNRFTEPHWIDGCSLTQGVTRVEVAIANQLLCREVEKNLEEWLKSPVSLLFFKKIRKLQIGELVVHWQSLGPGPVAQSEWMSLDGTADNAYLLIRSAEEAFPEDALDEIRQERMLGAEDSGDFPPCRVEIVLGAKGRLYVVLPTGVETSLPFACNAPFIQDPARLKIKDPETSPTNRWLLRRAGELAANAMIEWLGKSEAEMKDRATAYGLLPDVDRDSNTLDGSCTAIVELAFADVISDNAILLTEDGMLVADQEAIALPRLIFDVWPVEQAMALLDQKSRSALCQHIADADRAKLINWKIVEEFSKSDLIARLRTSHLPRPREWRQLLCLWDYIAPEITGWQSYQPDKVRIVPVQGKEVLYSASEVVRLGEKRLLQSEDDWEFLSAHLLVLNQNWPRFLAEQRRDKGGGDGRPDPTKAAYAILKKIGLDETSDLNAVVDRVAADFFGAADIEIADCVQLTQIAAKLGVTVGDSFRYLTTDMQLRPAGSTVLYDEDGSLEYLLPEAMQQGQLLHPDYVASFANCSREDWRQWVASGRSGLKTFIPLSENKNYFFRRHQVEADAEKRGLHGGLYYPYVTEQFVIEGWDFPAECWRHWEAVSKSDPWVWANAAGRILEQRDNYWSRAQTVRLSQISTTGSTRSITSEPLLADWLLKLRSKPCLPDTRDMIHVPADLLLRTPETEPLMDIEPFVHGLLDRESTRPLLELLGVRSAPSGPDRLLDRLRALAQANNAPIHEVEKWYRRLDLMLESASTQDALTIKEAFTTEKLILAKDGSWVTSTGVFLEGDEEDVPGAAIIRSSVLELSLWRRPGVAERPSAELALQWLNTLPSNNVLSPDEARRVRTLLARYPTRIWEECGHWVNLLNEWAEIDTLSYGLSMQSLFTYSHLYDTVKRKTADFRQLVVDTVRNAPFSSLQVLSDLVTDRLDQSRDTTILEDRRSWLEAFGTQLMRIQLNDTAETERVRKVAEAIAVTSWIAAPKLEVTPYLEGVPAGTARLTDILWLEDKLYVSPLSKAKLAKRVPEEIGKNLSPEIRAALAYSFERSPSDIKDYLEENFTLGSEPEAIESDPDISTAVVLCADKAVDLSIDDTRDRAMDGGVVEMVSDQESTKELDTPDPHAPTSPVHHPENELFEEDTTTRPRASQKPPRPPVIARFALALGYKLDDEDRFYHSDGSWIIRTSGARFPWERRSAGGEVQRRYYPKEHCLESDPLQIEAEIWSMLEQKPEAYSFILVTVEGEAVEMTGAHLRALRDGGKITIYPATYRLVYDLDH